MAVKRDDSTRVIDALRDPQIYDHPVDSVEVLQTHISWVVLSGEFVYKIKKPVDFGFLDFSTLRKRRHYCHKEVELNSRLSADLYLGVLPIRDEDGVIHLGGERGRIVEYAVQMRRLPQDRMLDNLLKGEGVDPEAIDEVARMLANFHENSATGPAIDRYGSPRVIRSNWEENFEQTAAFVGKTLSQEQYDYLRAWAGASMRRDQALFRQRVAGGRVRDGHGDLRASAICIADQIHIFDCIEFNERFRYADVAADVAFLAMDLAAKGRPDLSNRFVKAYVQASGDAHLLDVIDFYVCYRAYVRGKVEGFQIDDSNVTVPDKQEAARTAQQRFRQAVETAQRVQPPLLLLTCGLSGSGKSTVALPLANEFGMHLIASDVLRKELAGIEPDSRQQHAYGTGMYSKSFTSNTYREMLRRARPALESGTSVVLDATFSDRHWREAAVKLATDVGALFLCMECVADEEVTRTRLDQRTRAGTSVSDASWETYLAQNQSFDPVDELSAWQHIELNTSGTLQDTLAEARELLRERLQPAHFEVTGM